MAKKPIETDLTDVTDYEGPSLEEELDQEQEQQGKKGKKKKKEKKPKPDKEKKGGFPVIPVVVLLIIIGGITSVFLFNLFGIRDMTVSYLRGAPLVGQFFPAPSEEPQNEAASRYASMTPDEIDAEFTGLEYEVERLQASLKEAEDQKKTDDETIAYLREFEQQIEEYRDIKNRFDKMVVEGGTPENYIEFYKTISPENAERLYQDSLGEAQYNADVREQSATFAEMDETVAAESLEALLGSNSNLAIASLREMAIEDRAAIFDEMEPALVARINNLLEPAVPEDIPLATAPPLPEEIAVPTGTPAPATGTPAGAVTAAPTGAVTVGTGQ